MKKFLLALTLISVAVLPSCKKDKEFCWTCVDQGGNDFNGNLCGKSESDIDKMRQQGYSCSKNP